MDKKDASDGSAGSGEHHPHEDGGGQSDLDQESETAQLLKEKLLRALADAENARKRAERSRLEGREAGIADLISALAPALDNLDLAISSTSSLGQEPPKNTEAILHGLLATKRAIDDALCKAGIELLRPAPGEVADPNVHEIVSATLAPHIAAGHVAELVQPGYRIGKRLIRPARVIVAAPAA